MLFSWTSIVLAVLLGVVSAQDCPALYKRYSKDHTGCKPDNANCQKTSRLVSEEDKTLIVKLHNDLRNKVATGKETTGNLPAAGDMLQMEWSDELANVAQKHADQCLFDHDCNECREVQDFTVGQNLYQDENVGKVNWQGAIQNWYDEVKNFDASIVDSFGSDKGTGTIGHFTQVIWAKSWKIGCGFSQYKNGDKTMQLYSCNYGPGGNLLNAPVYVKGDACSKCPSNTACSKDNPGLCQVESGKHPVYPPTENYVYYCNFEGATNCAVSSPEGMPPWSIYNTLSGSYASIVLKPGESSLLNFTQPVPSQKTSCIGVRYRSGPNLDGQDDKGDAKELVYAAAYNDNSEFPLKSSKQFTTFSLSLSYDTGLTMAIKFSVPNGAPEQYFEVTEAFYKNGDC